jgi:hypothetical protein
VSFCSFESSGGDHIYEKIRNIDSISESMISLDSCRLYGCLILRFEDDDHASTYYGGYEGDDDDGDDGFAHKKMKRIYIIWTVSEFLR